MKWKVFAYTAVFTLLLLFMSALMVIEDIPFSKPEMCMYTTVIHIVNINSADKEELMSLDGIGEITAQYIIDYREKHGAFADKKELIKIKGIGEKKYKSIEDKICI